MSCAINSADDREGGTLTFKIDLLSTGQGLVLCISGRITAEDLEVVRNALDGHPVVAIDLAAVDLVDRDALALLAQTEAKGIDLRGCPTYIREWITRERESSWRAE
jgi:ABC-type transporter Mla MlaB component